MANFSTHLSRAASDLASLDFEGNSQELVRAVRSIYVESIRSIYEPSSTGKFEQFHWLVKLDATRIMVTPNGRRAFSDWASAFEWRDRNDFLQQFARGVRQLVVPRHPHCPCGGDIMYCEGIDLFVDRATGRPIGECSGWSTGLLDLESGELVQSAVIRPALSDELEDRNVRFDATLEDVGMGPFAKIPGSRWDHV